MPWDILIKVLYRATVQVRKVPATLQLSWIETRMNGEREAWVEEYRNSKRTLGQVIAYVYTAREAVWVVDDLTLASTVHESPRKKEDAKPRKRDKSAPAKTVSAKLRDGSRLCQAYNRGTCTRKANVQAAYSLLRDGCTHGRHYCGGVEKSGRICGGHHPAALCRNSKVPRLGIK